MNSPRVTVLMPVYNGGSYLREAIASILGQSFTDFELLIIDDGSGDDSAAIAASHSDARIRLVRNERNLGLIATLNRGLELATGEYIARMDCDDISLPDRLLKQVRYLDSHPAIGLCGTWFLKFGQQPDKPVRWETDPAGIRCATIFSAAVGHPTVMFRRRLFLDNRLCFDPAFAHAEDYDLWERAQRITGFANIGEVLLRYRVHPEQVTQRLSQQQIASAGKVRRRQLQALCREFSEEEFAIHQAISSGDPAGIDKVFSRGDQWLCRLIDCNRASGLYPEPAFSRILLEQWFMFCNKAFKQGSGLPELLRPYRIVSQSGLGWGYVAKLAMRHLRI